MTSKQSLQCWMRVMPSLFELVYSGENAFHITMTDFYTIDFTNAPEIQSILGFESSVLVKGLDNPRLFFLSTSCNQIMVTNGTTSYVLSMFSEYYTFLEFIVVVNNKMFIVLSIISMKIEKKVCDIQYPKRRVVFWSWKWGHDDRWIWLNSRFKLSPSVHNLCMERSRMVLSSI